MSAEAAILVDSYLWDLPAGRCWPCWPWPSPSTCAWGRCAAHRSRWPCRWPGAGWPSTARPTGCPATTCTPTARPTPSTWSTTPPTGPARGWPGGRRPGGRTTSPGSAGRSWPRPTPPWSGRTTASATTGAAPRRRPCSTWWPRGWSASCWVRGGSSATTSCSTWRRGLRRPGPPAPRLGPGPSRRPGRRRPAPGRVRQLRQLLRAPPPLPAHGPPQRAPGRRPAPALRLLPGGGRRPRRRPPQPGAVHRFPVRRQVRSP